MHYELYTLDGKALLDHARIHMGKKALPALDFSEDIILSCNRREDSALFYQLGKVLEKEIAGDAADRFHKILFYVDFGSAKPIEEETLSSLFNNGFSLCFDGEKATQYVPFVTSQSQIKDFVYSFVRADVFAALMPRLDLDLPLEKGARTKSLSYLSKLYAYRALHMSSATPVLRFDETGGEDFFSCENIVVLPEKEHKLEVEVFTANATKEFSKGGDAVLEQKISKEDVSLNCFDGVGIMSLQACELINRYAPSKLKGNSFQVRMPFLKGVLHSVDFHGFLREFFRKHKGLEIKEAFVKDAFGIRRDLFRANIIIRPSVFKLTGLLKSYFPSTEARDRYFREQGFGGDVMKYYFEKIRQYNHGLYLVKSERSFQNTQYVHLSSQQLSTFDLKAEELDGIVSDHIQMANAFTVENLSNEKQREQLLQVEDKDPWMELLLKDDRFLKDPHINSIVRSHRISLFNEIVLGKLLVRGENRFLCGDLYVFLLDLAQRVVKNDGTDTPVFGKIFEILNKNERPISKNAVYMPGVRANGQRVALVRSPHLSRNEDVCTIVKQKDVYNRYFEHLTGVVMTGDLSLIPAALGGADFDGDFISVIFDRRIIDACFRSGYTEINKIQSALPVIHIKEIKAMLPPERAKIQTYRYVCPRVVYTTFSNRIGQISNTAMKIAAVEYDPNLKKQKDLPSAAFCTILTGNEIDATKKGIRPYIDDVQFFSKDLGEEARRVVKDIENYIEMKRALENKKGEIPEISINEAGKFCLPDDSPLPVKIFEPNRGRNAVTLLLYRWAKAFYEFRKEDEEAFHFDRKALMEIFPAKAKKATLCKDIIAAFRSADNAFREHSEQMKRRNEKIAKLTSMETVRLKGQYDNIYHHTKVSPSYKDRFDQFKNKLMELTENVDKGAVISLKDFLYSVEEKKFNAETFWPYKKNENAKENALLEMILALPYGELLFNFDFEGYRLLNYALEEVIARKETVDVSKKANKNQYTKKYFEELEKGICNRIGRSKFEQDLAKIVIEDLAKAEGLDWNCAATKSELIARLYPQYDASLTGAFWKIFGENEVLSVLGGKTDA